MSWWLTQRIIYITLLSTIVVFAAVFHKKLNKPYSILFFLLAATLIFESLAVIVAYNKPPKNDNSWVYELFSPIQACLISFVYFFILQNKSLRKLCLYMLLGTILIICYEYFFLDYKKSNLNVVSRSIFYLSLSLILMLDWLLKPAETAIGKEPAFWMNNGMFLFYTVNILFWSIYKTPFFKALELGYIFKKLLYFSNLILYSLILLSFILLVKNNRHAGIENR